MESRFVVCIKSDQYPASLEVRKLYARIPDAEAERRGQVRIVDESGEDYLYPSEYFQAIDLPAEVEGTFAGGA
jgi:hypothetical protein